MGMRNGTELVSGSSRVYIIRQEKAEPAIQLYLLEALLQLCLTQDR